MPRSARSILADLESVECVPSQRAEVVRAREQLAAALAGVDVDAVRLAMREGVRSLDRATLATHAWREQSRRTST